LAVTVTGGNRNDITQLLPLLDAVPPVRGRPGRPRRKPATVYADRAMTVTSTAGCCAAAGSVR
jgi:Transposase DDE domain